MAKPVSELRELWLMVKAGFLSLVHVTWVTFGALLAYRLLVVLHEHWVEVGTINIPSTFMLVMISYNVALHAALFWKLLKS